MAVVKNIIIYPIKSLGGIEVSSALANARGFENDRRWMLVDESGKFQSQREINQLALFKTSFDKNGILVTYNDDQIHISFSREKSIVRSVNVFDDRFTTNEVDDEISDWFSHKLNRDLKLVKMTSASQRVKKFKSPPYQTKVSLADGYPYLILGTASMDLLNSKLEAPININRFRPNIIVDTKEAHIEDEWTNLKANNVDFLVIKPCARCNVTTVNQESSKVGKEPLKTLSTYRRKENKIFFGSNMMVTQTGILNVGENLLNSVK